MSAINNTLGYDDPTDFNEFLIDGDPNSQPTRPNGKNYADPIVFALDMARYNENPNLPYHYMHGIAPTEKNVTERGSW